MMPALFFEDVLLNGHEKGTGHRRYSLLVDELS